jgi:tripeptidyl-peptidase-2
VQALDAHDISRGPIFSLPVTVIMPEPSPPPLEPTKLAFDLLPGAPSRRFLAVPDSAEWATVRIKTGAMPNGPHSVIVHAVPSARGDLPHAHIETKRVFALREHTEEVVQVPVRGGSTAELTMQLSWLANPSRTSVTATVHFHSYGARGRAMATSNTLRIGAADGFARLEVSAPLGVEKLKPRAELEAVERAVRPASSVISAASAQLDVLPPSDAERAASPVAVGTQIHEMRLEYKFDVAGDKDKPLSILPRVQSLHQQLYDSPLDSMLWRLQDADGAILAYGGAMHDAKAVDLKKGSYTVSLLLRHPDRSQLNALAHLPLLLRTKLAKKLDCPVYGARDAAMCRGHDGAKPFQEMWLQRGGHADLYVAPPADDDAVPAWAVAGNIRPPLTTDLLQPHALVPVVLCKELGGSSHGCDDGTKAG